MNKTHGCAGHGTTTTEYKAWKRMKYRCFSPKSHKYHSHGSRGITVCERWANSFVAFLEDMGEKPKGTNYSLDRIDNNKGYSKENCRWATVKENCRNTRKSRYWFIDGVKYESLTEAASALNISTDKIWYRSNSNNYKNYYSELKYK